MEGERTEQELQRRQKLTTLRSQGIEPYQSRFDRTHSSAEALALFEQAEKSAGAEARTLLAKVDKLGEEPYKRFTDLDLGDIIGVHGTLFRTKRGEITCEIEDFVLLAKALR
ncbi:MAG: lysine--tRNA ligase, partial [Chloroflexota bacterium]